VIVGQRLEVGSEPVVEAAALPVDAALGPGGQKLVEPVAPELGGGRGH
jgi:hypothetical protein